MVDSAMVIRALEPADIRATAALLAEAMADDPAYNFLFPRGQGHVARGERHWVVHMMAVDPARQGRGLGSHLLNCILEATVDARTTGGKAVSVKRVVQWNGQCMLQISIFSGFSRTAPTGVQLRVPRVHRRGVRALAFA